MFPGMAIDKISSRGGVITCCNVALTVLSAHAAEAAGLPKDKARAEWVAGLLPGVHVVPSGVLAVGRAQEKGCSYCYAG
jgi:intracellular sulfur oxidation DsrE/DsrF family protein